MTYYMKQLSFIFLLLSIFIEDAFCQWPQVFGTEYYWATPNHTREAYDKGFLLTLDFEPQQYTPYGSCIIKTDINGNQLWKKQIGNSSKHLEIKGITFDAENNIYISGGTAQFDQQRDPFIMKLNPCMEVEWCKIYRSPDLDDLANEIVYISALNTFIVNFIYVRANDNIRLMNIDPEGDEIWSNYYCFSPDYTGTMPIGICHFSVDTSVILYGFTYSRIENTSNFELEPYWLKVAHDGNFLWENYRLPDTVFFRGTAKEEPILLNSNALITGVTETGVDPDGKLVRLNFENGNYEWIQTLHEPDTASKVCVNSCSTMNGNIYTGVQYFVTGYDPTGHGSLQKNDSLGNFLLETIMPVDFTTVIEDICPTHDNKLMVSATHSLVQNDVMLIKYTEDLVYDSLNTAQVTYDSLCPTTITSGTVELACNIITGLKNKSKRGISKLSIAPNPADDYAVIYLPETIETGIRQGVMDVTTFRSDYVKNLTIEVVNINGQTIHTASWPDNIKEQVLTVADWNPGLYLIQIRNQNRILSTGKLLVR